MAQHQRLTFQPRRETYQNDHPSVMPLRDSLLMAACLLALFMLCLCIWTYA